jgi:hypothetical protein
LPDYRWGLKPVLALLDELMPAPAGDLRDRQVETASLDFLPIGQCAVNLLLRNKGEMTVWRGNLVWDYAEVWHNYFWGTRWSDKPIEQFNVNFTDPFWVGGTDHQYLFVTQSGELHVATKTDDKRKVEVAWRRGTQPIVAIITDVEANRTFAFTKPLRDVKLDGKSVYFELGPDPKPEVYDRDAILKDAKDDPAAVTALARFLVDQKKITLKK